MKKLFTLQKITASIYIIVVICTLLYSLGFMNDYTNFSDFKKVQMIAEMHDDLMQPYNLLIFYCAVIGIVSIGLIVGFKVFKFVSNRLSLIAISTLSLSGIVAGIATFINFPKILSIYNQDNFLDLYKLENSNLPDHVKTYTTFNMGYALYGILIFVTIAFVATLTISHLKLTSKKDGE